MQLSILSQLRTAEILEETGLAGRVVDFGFFRYGPVFTEHVEQIQRVEALSDAYHLDLGGEDVVVSYLLEITRRTGVDTAGSRLKRLQARFERRSEWHSPRPTT